LTTWAIAHSNCPECRNHCPQAPAELYYDASRVDAERAKSAARAAVAAETTKQKLQAEVAALTRQYAAKEAACVQLQRQNAQLQSEKSIIENRHAAMVSLENTLHESADESLLCVIGLGISRKLLKSSAARALVCCAVSCSLERYTKL
jgi:hypothetical protein